MNWQRHLVLQEILVEPACEWQSTPDAWYFVRLKQGQAYWLAHSQTLELAVDSVLVLPPGALGTLRASQIGPVQLQYFTLHPDGLTDLLTLIEREHLESAVARAWREGYLAPKDLPLGAAFRELAATPATEDNFKRRCQALLLAALAFNPEFSGLAPFPVEGNCATRRFAEVVQGLSEEEIIRRSPRELAKLCGCSPRHFSRLFHERFGRTLRKRQTEIRLRKAQRLLSQSEVKIINVAMDCGYRHLGLFNAMFRKYLGMTPTEWRQRQGRKQPPAPTKPKRVARAVRFVVLAGALLLLALVPAKGAGPAGPATETREQRIERIEQEIEAWRRAHLPPKPTNTIVSPTNTAAAPTNSPAPGTAAPDLTAADREARRAKWHLPPLTSLTNHVAGGTATNKAAAMRFEIRGFDLAGNSLLPQELADEVLEDYKGKDKSMDDIRAALGELLLTYRARGFVTVGLSLPPQKLTNGIVKVQVTEGRVSDITIVSNRYYSVQNIRRALPSLKTNSILNNLVFQQELERANANRDRQIYPRVSPGSEPGTSSLKLVIKDRVPLHGRFDVNNAATPGTPDYRAGAAITYNNLWQLDHQAGIQYSCSPTVMKQANQMPNFLDQPLVASYSAFYKMPINWSQSARATQEYTVADFGYDEGTQRFRPPAYANNAELMVFASHSFSDTQVKLLQNNLTPAIIDTNKGGIQVSDKLYNQSLIKNDDLGLRLQKPFNLGWQTTLFAAFGMDFKRYDSQSFQDKAYQATIFYAPTPTDPNPAPTASDPQVVRRAVAGAVDYLPFSATLSLSRPDRYGSTEFTWNNSFNFARLLASTAAFQAASGSLQSSGNYYVTTMAFTREQQLVDDWFLRVRADGQWANEPLLSNEQLGLGGAAGPRGYMDGSAYFDTGWRVMIEPHTTLLDIGMVDGTKPMLVRLGVFTDYAQGYYLGTITSSLGSESLWSAGFNLGSTIGETVDMRLTLGWVLQDSAHFSTGARASFSFALQF